MCGSGFRKNRFHVWPWERASVRYVSGHFPSIPTRLGLHSLPPSQQNGEYVDPPSARRAGPVLWTRQEEREMTTVLTEKLHSFEGAQKAGRVPYKVADL